MLWIRLAAALVMAATGLVACGDDEAADEPRRTAFPDEVSVFIDQARTQRRGREVFIRLINEDASTVTVRQADIYSDRFTDASWDGEETFQYEIDLEFELPTGTCGTGSDATVELTYRLSGEEDFRISEVTAPDRYGAIGLFLDRDCAQQTLLQAADLEVGEPEVVDSGTGSASESAYRLPVTLTPTGDRDDVRFTGFGGTVLFDARGEWADPATDIPLGPSDPAVHAVLEIVPARCDPHALAEDKVGTLFDTRIRADGLAPESSSFYLPLTDETRSAMFTFFKDYCGLPG